MKVDIQGKEVAARYSIRAFMLFESITGKVFQGGTVTDEVTMMFATLLPSEPSISFEDVVNLIDENPAALVEWRKWFGSESAKQAALIADTGVDAEKKN